MSMDQITLVCLVLTACSTSFVAILLNKIANDLTNISHWLERSRTPGRPKEGEPIGDETRPSEEIATSPTISLVARTA